MASIKIEIDDQAVMPAFNRLLAAGDDPSPIMRLIGEGMAESTRMRFEQSRAPDGTPWKPLAQSTYEGLVAGRKSNLQKKSGRLSALGAQRVAGRKPLIGETRMLSTTIGYQLEGSNAVVIGTPMEYGFVHQLGGKKTYTILPKNKQALAWPGGAHPVKKVVHPPLPARPFLGVSVEDRDEITQILRDAITGAWRG
jgi:phage virion morphogenesis protein